MPHRLIDRPSAPRARILSSRLLPLGLAWALIAPAGAQVPPQPPPPPALAAPAGAPAAPAPAPAPAPAAAAQPAPAPAAAPAPVSDPPAPRPARAAAKPAKPAKGPGAKPAPRPAPPKPAPRPVKPPPSAYEIILTFDDGPRIDTTPKVLEALDQYGIKSVFFVNGVRFMGKGKERDRLRELMKDTLRRGHIIGNHTVHHFFLCGKRGPTIAEKEILDNAALIEEATGQKPPLFRTPFGSHCPTLSVTLGKLGIKPIGWDIDPEDWKKQDAQLIFDFMTHELKTLKRARSVVLFHDVQPATAEMLPRLLKWIVDENAQRRTRHEPEIKILDYRPLLAPGAVPGVAPMVPVTPATPPGTPGAPAPASPIMPAGALTPGSPVVPPAGR